LEEEAEVQEEVAALTEVKAVGAHAERGAGVEDKQKKPIRLVKSLN
jgi:threonine dehydrogenase-like Zn-dependent dehydrogenase